MKKLISACLALVLLLSCFAMTAGAASAECAYTVNGVTEEGTLADAVAAVKTEGGTITLLRDVNYTGTGAAIQTSVPITLDLGGFTLSAKSGYNVRVGSSSESVRGTKMEGATVIKNGVLLSQKQNTLIYQGGLVMQNVIAWNETSANVNYYDLTGDHNETNLIDGCVLANPVWAAFSFNNSNHDQGNVSFTIRNSKLACVKLTGSAAITRQSTAGEPQVVLGENVSLYLYTPKQEIEGRIRVRGNHAFAFRNQSLYFLDKAFHGLYEYRTTDLVLPTVTVEETAANRVAAIMETARAYQRKIPYVQYDNLSYTGSSSRGNRNSEARNNSPEFATAQRNAYQVCSTFTYATTFHTFGFKLLGGWENNAILRVARQDATASDAEATAKENLSPYTVYQVNLNDLTEDQKLAEMAKFRNTLQPGDVIYYYRNRDSGPTHTVIWMGQVIRDAELDMINVDGDYYDKENKKEIREDGKDGRHWGGVLYNTSSYSGEYLFFNKKGYDYFPTLQHVSVLRYTDAKHAEKLPLTESVKTRLQYPGLNIWFEEEKSNYGTVAQGGEYTYTLRLENNSNHTFNSNSYPAEDYENIYVQLPVPENAMITKVDGVAAANETVTWTVSVPIGTTVKKTVTVKATGEVGSEVVAYGFVHGIALPELYTPITAAAPASATKVTAAMEKHVGKTPEAFVDAVSKELGGVSIPTLQTLKDTLFTKYGTSGNYVNPEKHEYHILRFKNGTELTAADRVLSTLLLPDYYGGRTLGTAVQTIQVTELRAKDMQAGDILMWQAFQDSAVQVAVHNGTNWMRLDNGVLTAMTQADLDEFLYHWFFVGLRPVGYNAKSMDPALVCRDEGGSEQLESLPAAGEKMRLCLDNAPAESTALVAFYNGSTLVETNIVPISGDGVYQTELISVPAGVNKARAFVLNSITELLPVANMAKVGQ